MRLTRQQRAAVDCKESAAIYSCPGSGKTRTIVSKLLTCVEEVLGTSRRVAAITYTNAAVDEIESRLREHCTHEERIYYEISTIHSFCLNNIFRPFHDFLAEFGQGFTLLPPEDDRWQTKTAELARAYSISRWAAENFEQIQRLPNGNPVAPEGIPIAAAEKLCTWCDENAYVSLSEIVYHSLRLVQQCPFIASGLASRFAWMLIDEFQDSSAIQVEVLKRIAAFGRTRFFLVGDPLQSIYRFAGADADLMKQFAVAVQARTDLPLSGNFRSCPGVIEVAEALSKRSPRMKAVGEYRNYPAIPRHTHARSAIDAVVDDFLPIVRKLGVPLGEAAVLASSWPPLFHMARALRKRGVPVIGPGARPYKRSHVFSALAEPVCAYLESAEPDIALAVQRALFVTLREITGQAEGRVFSYRGKCVVSRLLRLASQARKESRSAVRWLIAAADSFTKTLLDEGYLPTTKARALIDSADLMCDEISRNEGGTPITLEELGLFARPKNCLFLTTIHKAKGREFEAVAIVDLHDGKIPFFKWDQASTLAERRARWEDARRLLYVAITRAKRELLLVTDDSSRDGRSPFLSEIEKTLC